MNTPSLFVACCLTLAALLLPLAGASGVAREIGNPHAGVPPAVAGLVIFTAIVFVALFVMLCARRLSLFRPLGPVSMLPRSRLLPCVRVLKIWQL